MMRHRVFSTVSGSPLLFWIFRMSASKEEEKNDDGARARYEYRFERERDALVDPKQSFLALSRLSHFFKNRTTTQSFSDPHVMRAREREETSPRERERERESKEKRSVVVVVFCGGRARSKLGRGRQKDHPNALEGKKERSTRERERFENERHFHSRHKNTYRLFAAPAETSPGRASLPSDARARSRSNALLLL